eukprot:scaffold1352_cov144-Cylindrotheca_fusiformis.AAC.8
MAATFKAMTPYLKGIHLTLDSWRVNRRSDGWKMSPKEWAGFLAGIEDQDLREQVADLGNAGHPPFVHPVERLEGDIETLRSFFKEETPTRVCVRPSRFVQRTRHPVLECLFTNYSLGFGDASGNGFGGTFLSTAGLSYQIGVWKYQATSSCSFEFRNLLDALSREGEAGRLSDSFVLMMTDNQPVEEALFKGTSASKSLLQMVQEFHSLEMEFGFVALICHCSGKRMIAQGTDADVALEELRKARIKRQLSLHVILIPRLCTPSWLRQLFKAADIILEIPPGTPFWPSDMYEPLFVGILLPFSRFEPWSLRFSPKGVFCTNSFHSVGGFPPCHGVWCATCYSLDSNSAGFYSQADDREVHRLVGNNPTTNLWGPKAPDLKQFDEARPGDHLLSPFLIIRANLDVFWSRTRSTVKTNRGTVERTLASLTEVGLQGPFYDPGPTPFRDFCGFETAIGVLMDSQKGGKYHASQHKQWDSIRKVKSSVASFEKVSNKNPLSQLTLVEAERGFVQRFHYGQSASLWYQRFASGCKKARMGQDVRPNQALKTELWIRVLEFCRERARGARSVQENEAWIMAGAYFAFTYVLSLRGPEGFMFEISLLREHRRWR